MNYKEYVLKFCILYVFVVHNIKIIVFNIAVLKEVLMALYLRAGVSTPGFVSLVILHKNISRQYFYTGISMPKLNTKYLDMIL